MNCTEFQEGDGYGGRGVHVTPAGADASVIFMHGRGDSGKGWANLADLISERKALCGRVRLFLPTADEMMVSKYGIRMNAWFDSRSDRRDVDEDFEGFEKSRKRVENIIQKEVEKGIKPQRIIVAGFSQGGAMAYYVPLRSAFPIGGSICMSGWCPFLHDLQIGEAFKSSRSPFLHAHGAADSVVDYEFARKAYEAAKEAAQEETSHSNRFQFKTYPGLAHTACGTEMQDVMDFIESCLAPNALGK